jgi:co-chaperonin GroES (HSP10)
MGSEYELPEEEALQFMDSVERASSDDDGVERILHPSGFRILVKLLPPEETLTRWLDSKLKMPDDVREREWQAQVWAQVLELGPEAYLDKERFRAPWCKVGDRIILRPYSGTRFMVRGQLYALINDDTVLAVITDVGELERA